MATALPDRHLPLIDKRIQSLGNRIQTQRCRHTVRSNASIISSCHAHCVHNTLGEIGQHQCGRCGINGHIGQNPREIMRRIDAAHNHVIVQQDACKWVKELGG